MHARSVGRPLSAATLIAFATLASAALQATDNRPASTTRSYAAWLTSTQEVPAVSSVARGRIELTVDTAAETIRYELEFSGLEGAVTQAHIHTAQFGVNGGIMLWLCGTTALPGPAGTPVCPGPNAGSISGTLTPAQIVVIAGQGIAAGEFAEVARAIANGVTYANVHSSKFGGGEIRGQIVRRWGRGDD
jgi:hypothetical protein